MGLDSAAESIPQALVIAGDAPDVPCVSRGWSWDAEQTATYQIQRAGEPALRPYTLAERCAPAHHLGLA
ncbi:MAG: hypothetical protein Tsb0020_10340 [Haliangiales bacterium]